MPGNSLDRRLIKQGPRFDVSVVVSRRINREGVIPADPRHRIGRSFSSRVRKVVMGGALAIAVSDDFVPDRNRPLGNLIPRPAIHYMNRWNGISWCCVSVRSFASTRFVIKSIEFGKV